MFFDESQICISNEEKAHGAAPMTSFLLGTRSHELLRGALEAPRGHQQPLLASKESPLRTQDAKSVILQCKMDVFR